MQTRSGGPSDLYRDILRETLNVKRETAWDFAMRMWKRASDEPRQSSLLKDRNAMRPVPPRLRFSGLVEKYKSLSDLYNAAGLIFPGRNCIL